MVFSDETFDPLGVCEVGVEFPDRGCRAFRDVEDDVLLNFRGVACVASELAVAVAGLVGGFERDFNVSVRFLRVMFTT